MKRVSIVLLGLAGLMPVCVSAASATVLPAQEVSSTQYTLGEASTLRLISRAYFPDSASTRSFFIRRIAAANPTVFSRNQQQVFDQSLARGQKLMVPAGLLPSSTAASLLLPLVSAAPVADVRVHAQLKITGAAALAEAEVEGLPVSLQSFASLMAGADEMIRAHRLEEDIAEQGVQGAKGIYEPFVIASMEREGMFIPTSAQDKLQQGYQNTYRMIENRLKTGLLFKAPTGADIELSYSLAATQNSLQAIANRPSPEYKGALGFKINQPLLRGMGPSITESGITIAETDKTVAKETVRQVTAQRLIDGLQAYISAQRAQERVKIRQQAAHIATAVEMEITRQHQAGLRSVVELTEARAQWALRHSQLAQAQQEQEEQLTALQVYVSAKDRQAGTPVQGSLLRPADPLLAPRAAAASKHGTQEKIEHSVSLRPETRVNAVKIERESHKIDAAQNQALPELNFTVRAGKDRLSESVGSFEDYFSKESPYRSWMVGLNLKIGLGGDLKKSSEYESTVLRREQIKLAQDALRQRIATEVSASTRVMDKALLQVTRQQDIVSAQQSLLKTEKILMDEGRRSAVDVMKKKLDLLQAEEALVDVLAHSNRASFMLSLVEGTLLSRLALE